MVKDWVAELISFFPQPTGCTDNSSVMQGNVQAQLRLERLQFYNKDER